jgi:hypothetical protein
MLLQEPVEGQALFAEPRDEAAQGALREKTGFGNGSRSPLVTGNAPVTDQVLQISQEM